MTEGLVDELKTATGKSYFAEFVIGLVDRTDVKDTAVLVSALRALGNRLREPHSKSLTGGLFELRGTRVRCTMDFCRDGEPACWADM